MTKRLTKRLLPLMLTSLFAVSGAYAQNTSSALSGRVVDAAGQPVGGASVQILHVPSGTVSTVTTNAEGRYQAQGLRVGGPYRVVAENKGVTVSADDVYLRLAETTTINLVEEATEGQLDTITVTANALSETFSADNKGVGTNLSQRELIAMPQPDRSIQNVVRADPRIVVTDRDRGAFSAAGQNFRYNSITVDTVNAGDPFGLNDNGLPTLGSPISPDAIEEYNISTANYDVTSRRGVGASVNAVTKSGTNEFKGSAYYAYQNSEDMVGENAAGNDWTGYSSKYTAGATFGGPIVEDTLFFFLSYEESSQKSPGAVWGPEGSGATNIVQGLTQSMVDQVIAAAATYGIDAGSTAASNVDLESKRGLVKIDWNINAAHRASFRASRTEETQPVIVVGASNRLNLSSNWYLFDKENTSYALSLYDDWTDTFSTEASIGYNKFDQTRGPLVGGYQPAITVRMGGESGVPSVVLGTEVSSQANVLGVETWNGYFAGNWFLGDHTVKAGFDYQKDDYYNLFLQRYNGDYEFNSIADFLSGTYRRYRVNQPAPGYSLNNVAAVFDLRQWGFFVQDTWQASDRLSIQYGLRYDLPQLGVDPTYNPCFASDPGTLGTIDGVCGLRRSTTNPNAAYGGYGFSNQSTIDGNGVVQPRFSANYALDTERMTQVRGGAGMFISNTPGVWIANPYSNNGVAVAQYDVNRLRTPTDPVFSPDPFDQDTGTRTLPGLGSSSMGVDLVDKDFELPTVFKFTLGVDHELPWLGLIATAEYQKLDVYRGIWYQHLNLGAPTGTLPDGRLAYSRDPNAAPGSSNTTRWNANPSFGTVTYLTNTKKGGSDSVTLSLKKPFEDNWSGMLGFTWTRATDVNPGTSSVANSSFLNRAWYNPNDDYESTSNYDVPRRVIAQLTWSKALFGDYNTSISGFFDGHSGTPYSWTFGNDVNGDSYVNDLAYIPASIDDVAWAAAVTPQMQQQFMDYINNDQYLSDYRGKIFKRNKARAPWINQLDVSFRQEFPGFFKGNKAEFRLDIFNFTNLLNKDWGVEQRADFPLRRNLADVRGVDAQGRYIYDISGSQYNQGGNYSPAALPVNESFNPSQRWSVMATVRYSF
ncbi:MAG: TonB-dependent receptor [Xanthomonadales bacterium]|nr:TonB-dependent receptor [Xanthomonadales bacterium]